MIKELLHELVQEEISLSKALTKSKLISMEIDNQTFKEWLNKELNGYDFEDPALPSYRKIYSPLSLVATMPGNKEIIYPIIGPKDLNEEQKKILNIHQALEPISLIEIQIQNLEETTGQINLKPELIEILKGFLSKREIVQIQLYQGQITRGHRDIGKLHLNQIIELTKQKLIDTLADFSKEFPDLMDNFKPSQENNEKVQNIVNNHIYGGTNAMNTALGLNVTQKDNSIIINQSTREKLEKLGVEEEDIIELAEIVKNENGDKKGFGDNIFDWLGKVSASIAAKGLYENIPELTEFVRTLVP